MNREDLIKKLIISTKIIPTQQSRTNASSWFKRALTQLTKEKNSSQRFTPGNLFMFFYDPINKDKLPYYDKFPLIILIKKNKDGFLGINLHYIPSNLRALILLNLVKSGLIVESSNDDVLRFKITYSILERLSYFKVIKPCIKEYKFNKVYSKIINIKSNEWDNVINLPFEQFVKENKKEVWKNSIKETKQNQNPTIKSSKIEYTSNKKD